MKPRTGSGLRAFQVPESPRARLMTEHHPVAAKSYDGLLQSVVHLLEEARRSAARSVNATLTAGSSAVQIGVFPSAGVRS